MVTLNVNIKRTGESTGLIERTGVYPYEIVHLTNLFKEDEITYENARRALDFLTVYMAATEAVEINVDIYGRNKEMKPKEMTIEEIESALGHKIIIVEGE